MLVYTLVLAVLGACYAAGVRWLLLGLRRSFRRKSPSPRHPLPTVSVVLPARNEEQTIGSCLEALSRQDYPSHLWQLVVVDDASEDHTRERVLEWTDRIPQLRLMQAPPGCGAVSPKKNALLAAIAHTDGQAILTTDADARVGAHWISIMAGNLAGDAEAVVGPVFVRGAANALQSFQHVESVANATLSAAGLGWGVGITCIGANFGYTRQAFENVGGFGPTARVASGDDDLLLQRLTRSGLTARFVTEPGATVYVGPSMSIGHFWSRRRRHLSAARRYPLVLRLVGAGWFLFSALIVAGVVIGALCRASLLVIGLAAWLWKAGLEVGAVRQGAKAFGERLGWREVLLAVVVHPWLFAAAVPASLFGKVAWRGRRLKA